MASNSLQNSPCPPEWRIILVGKTGSGKSSLGNTLLGEELLDPNNSSRFETAKCASATKKMMKTQLTLIDTPGLLDVGRSEEDQKSEIICSLVECAPGPHVFLIVLKVEKYTKHEEEVVTKIIQYFSEEVLKYSVIVFTHGDDLKEGTTIQQFVNQNEKLKDLVRKCDDRCHVFDSRYWKNDDPEEKYRSNSYQLKELLSTVEKLVERNKGKKYTNEMLREVEQEIQKHEKEIGQSGSHLSVEEIRKRAQHKTIISLGTIPEGFNVGSWLPALIGMVSTSVTTITGAFFTTSTLVIGAVAGFGADLIARVRNG